LVPLIEALAIAALLYGLGRGCSAGAGRTRERALATTPVFIGSATLGVDSPSLCDAG